MNPERPSFTLSVRQGRIRFAFDNGYLNDSVLIRYCYGKLHLFIGQRFEDRCQAEMQCAVLATIHQHLHDGRLHWDWLKSEWVSKDFAKE